MNNSNQNNISRILAMKDAIIVLGLDDLRTLLEEIIPKYAAPQKEKDEQITSKEVCEYLHICSRTLQRYRDMRIIPYYQKGRKISYSRSEIEAFQEQFRIKTRY